MVLIFSFLCMFNVSQTHEELAHLLYICLPVLAHPLHRKRAQVNHVVSCSFVAAAHDVINSKNLLSIPRQEPQTGNAHGTRRGRGRGSRAR